MGRKITDLTGKVFGKLTVLSFDRKGNNYQSYWHCTCECGNEVSVMGGALNSGNTNSCGCYKIERTSKARTKHGETKGKAGTKKNYHPLYGVWCGMKNRCYSKSNKRYSDYGGRGIKVCDEWKNNFPAFKEWSLNNGWQIDLELDRENNNGDYSTTNCRYVTSDINNNNRRNNIAIQYNGQTKSIKEWAKEIGIKERTLYSRLIEKKYPVEKALTRVLFKTDGTIKLIKET